ncbi:MAG: hypothetical protein WKF28_03935 [Rubrobacteraceae bacterium]|jgi:hypothetical protein
MQVDLFSKKAEDGAQIETREPNGKVEIITHKPNGTSGDPETSEDLTNIALPQPPNRFTARFSLTVDDNSMENLWLALTWGGGE